MSEKEEPTAGGVAFINSLDPSGDRILAAYHSAVADGLGNALDEIDMLAGGTPWGDG